jgi:hypothetical protein
MKIVNEQHEMKSAGASTAPSEASPRIGWRRPRRRSNEHRVTIVREAAA